MQLYLYAKSGHNFGLENVRRISAIQNMLLECNPIVCTADYRAATFSKNYLGVRKGVGVDIIDNLPNVMQRSDMLIYDDSKEASDTMKEYMEEFCTHLYEVGNHIPLDIVDEQFFENTLPTKYKVAMFFADDDYSNWFFNLVQQSSKLKMPLVVGHYFFFGNEDILKEYFTELLEEEDYIDTVKTTQYLLTSSVHTALESLASGNQPVYFKRYDKDSIENLNLLQKYNIPIIDIPNPKNLDTILDSFYKIIDDYPQLNSIARYDISDIKTKIQDTLKKYESIVSSLEYKY